MLIDKNLEVLVTREIAFCKFICRQGFDSWHEACSGGALFASELTEIMVRISNINQVMASLTEIIEDKTRHYSEREISGLTFRLFDYAEAMAELDALADRVTRHKQQIRSLNRIAKNNA